MVETEKERHEYSFTLILEGVASLEELEAGIYSAGCDDALVGMRRGMAFVDFDRAAESLSAAIMSAVDDIKTIQGATVLRIEPDDGSLNALAME